MNASSKKGENIEKKGEKKRKLNASTVLQLHNI